MYTAEFRSAANQPSITQNIPTGCFFLLVFMGLVCLKMLKKMITVNKTFDFEKKMYAKKSWFTLKNVLRT